MAPTVAEEYPAGQGVQLSRPVEFANDPAGHETNHRHSLLLPRLRSDRRPSIFDPSSRCRPYLQYKTFIRAREPHWDLLAGLLVS